MDFKITYFIEKKTPHSAVAAISKEDGKCILFVYAADDCFYTRPAKVFSFIKTYSISYVEIERKMKKSCSDLELLKAACSDIVENLSKQINESNIMFE